MTEKKYLAHRTKDGREEPISRHLSETAALAGRFADSFNAEKQGQLAGMIHDIGKYSDAFQEHLKNPKKRVDHSTAGAMECKNIGQDYAAFAVAGHHGGLPDRGSKTDNVDKSTFFGRYNRYKKGLLENYDAWKKEIKLPENVEKPCFKDPAEAMFFTRMLFSCLVDADFLTTAAFMNGRSTESNDADLETMRKKLDKYVKKWFPPQNELNKQRCAVLEQCRNEGRNQKERLFTLTVPTGGGKTVASLAFAIEHALKNNLHRIVYVIPYTSIIEQNAKEFRNILGDESVLEHHSGVVYDKGDEATQETIRMGQATENWDMPLIVTTAVQFFESMYSNRPSKCRKLHNLAKSVIIFDEAQMLPIPYLRPCLFVIAQLVKRYGATAVLCTATQPNFGEIFKKFLPNAEIKELCPPNIYKKEVFRRTVIRKIEDQLTYSDLSGLLNRHTQVLCIVNSRKAAQEVFDSLDGDLDGNGRFHLSTLMCPKHRNQILDEIRRRLQNGLTCRVVSTSLIEAGVDVDFPAVYREEAGLDSILQAAGRCNREGKQPADKSLVYVFKFKGDSTPPPIFSVPVKVGRKVLKNFKDITSHDAVRAYFDELLDIRREKCQDKKEILLLMQGGTYPFREIADIFHIIDDESARTIYIPFDEEGRELIKRLQSGERESKLFRKLSRYGVSVFQHQFEGLCKQSAIRSLDDDLAVLFDEKLYDSRKGLDLQSDKEGGALFV